MLNTGIVLAAAAETSTSVSLTDALGTVVTLASNAFSIITGNQILMVLFCASLMSVGFGVIISAKHAARS